MTQAIPLFQSDFGVMVLTPWLGAKADSLPTRKNGFVDMRYRASKRFFRRLSKLAQARYLAGVDFA